MPHLANSKEKIPMIIDNYLQGRSLSDIIDVKLGFDKDGHIGMTYNKKSLNDLIKDIVDNYLLDSYSNDEYFDKFVDIKEVPYGKHNSDPDYRGSGTKLP